MQDCLYILIGLFKVNFIIPKTNHGKHFALKLCTHRELAPPSVLVTPEILIWHLIA